MPSRENVVPVDVLRSAARERVDGSSLRQVASEIGISHHALHRFIHGSEPYGKTMAKLRAWHADEQNELVRLRQELAELKQKLAECQKELRSRR